MKPNRLLKTLALGTLISVSAAFYLFQDKVANESTIETFQASGETSWSDTNLTDQAKSNKVTQVTSKPRDYRKTYPTSKNGEVATIKKDAQINLNAAQIAQMKKELKKKLVESRDYTDYIDYSVTSLLDTHLASLETLKEMDDGSEDAAKNLKEQVEQVQKLAKDMDKLKIEMQQMYTESFTAEELYSLSEIRRSRIWMSTDDRHQEFTTVDGQKDFIEFVTDISVSDSKITEDQIDALMENSALVDTLREAISEEFEKGEEVPDELLNRISKSYFHWATNSFSSEEIEEYVKLMSNDLFNKEMKMSNKLFKGY